MVIPPQVSRPIVLAMAIVGAYFIARLFLVPASFGQYGWYRGNALTELADHPITYAGRKACEECHTDVTEAMTDSLHNKISCESCHGPNLAHALDKKVAPSKIDNPYFCNRCHVVNSARPHRFPQIVEADHYPDDGGKCLECHLPHQPTEDPSLQ